MTKTEIETTVEATQLAEQLNKITMKLHPVVVLLAVRSFELALTVTMGEASAQQLSGTERLWDFLKPKIESSCRRIGAVPGGN